MDQKQFNAIKERVVKATPGEWRSMDTGHVRKHYSVGNEEEFVAHTYDVNDAEFIAHARIDVPALVTEVERLQKALEKVMDAEEPIMEGTKGWETRSYEIARQALGGEAHE
ncbi:hypothetical protein [Lysinibacillus sphaericus]|uniref:hypothetical protein n=1 Tax=Lysinibacillus sphaericus TaxID=1421 RepID=UPI00056CBC75|nr:hypothetical protein [Lysinibacillus sphaericus]QPA60664.1 hypothetical protein INQ55_10195 [Lysinibacillus sphaericus]